MSEMTGESQLLGMVIVLASAGSKQANGASAKSQPLLITTKHTNVEWETT